MNWPITLSKPDSFAECDRKSILLDNQPELTVCSYMLQGVPIWVSGSLDPLTITSHYWQHLAWFVVCGKWKTGLYCLCMYLTGIHSCRLTCLQQVSLVISATFYYWFRGSTPLEIARGSYGQQRNSYFLARKYRQNRSGNVWRGARGKYSMNTL